MSFGRQIARLIIVVLLLGLALRPVKAQTLLYPESSTAPADSTARRAWPTLVPTEVRVPGFKSGRQALLWSLLGTVVPVGVSIIVFDESASSDAATGPLLFLGGVLVGPALGHFYAGRPGRALAGVGFRAVGLAGAAGGFAAAWNNNSGGDVLLLAGLALGATVLAWDILKAPHSADVHNKRLAPGRIAIALVPLHNATGVRLSTRISF